MGTTLRAELSEKNPYWIEKHRYYELKHFCLQYPIWKKAYAALDGTNTKTMNLAEICDAAGVDRMMLYNAITEKLPGGKIPENVFRKEEHMPLIWLLVGILIGLLVSRFIFKDKPIGSLRVDQSDPDSEPYLFLELDPGGMNDIYKKQSVRLRVKIKNYISHK